MRIAPDEAGGYLHKIQRLEGLLASQAGARVMLSGLLWPTPLLGLHWLVLEGPTGGTAGLSHWRFRVSCPFDSTGWGLRNAFSDE